MSRLEKIEQKRLAKQTGFLVVLTIVIVLTFIFFGIPALIKLAVNIGNQKAQSKFQLKDTTSPNTPSIDYIPVATNSGNLVISGYSEPDAVINVLADGVSLGNTIVNSEGQFQLPISGLAEGNHSLIVTATDPNQNQSLPSSAHRITIDQTPPEINITNPKNGEKIYGLNKQFVSIEGKISEPGKVTMNDTYIVVTNDNTFTSKIFLNEGENKFNFTVTDEAGNITTQEFSVSYYKQ